MARLPPRQVSRTQYAGLDRRLDRGLACLSPPSYGRAGVCALTKAIAKLEKTDAPIAYEQPTQEELQERQLQSLEIVADWKEDNERRRKRLELRMELTGDVEQEEVDELKRDNDRLLRCM